MCLVALNELNYFLACILFLPGHLQSRESHFGKTKMSCVSALLLQSNTSLCLIGKGDILCGKCVCVYNHIIPKFFLSHRLDMTATRLKTRNLASLSPMFPGCRQSHFPPQPCFQKIVVRITAELGPLTKHIAISSQCVVMCSVDYIFNPQCVPEGWSSNPTLDLH